MSMTKKISLFRSVPAALASLLGIAFAASAVAEELEILEDATTNMAASFEESATLRWEPGQVIVKFKEGMDPTTDPQIASMSASGQELIHTSGGGIIVTIGTDYTTAAAAEEGSRNAAQMVEQLNARDDVEYAQVNYIAEITVTPIDPGYAQQWHYFNNGNGANESLGGINMPQAWDITTGDASVIVAVVDTGILPGHADITGSPNQLGGHDMITSTFTSNDGDGRDANPADAGDAISANECPPFFNNPARGDSWHGTHVAGTIGVGGSNDATGVAGVAWQTGVTAVRVLGKCGGNINDINDGIRWAAGMAVPGVPNNPNPAQVINMSLGAPTACSNSPSTQAAINDVVALGVTVIVAAGNDAMDAANALPASCNGVIAVAAGDENGALVTSYSNFGNTVDILAPGGDVFGSSGAAGGVLSTVQGGYAFYQGTSMATPHVAGVAALMLAVDSTLSPQDILTSMQTTANARTNAQCPQPCGAGLLDAFAAIQDVSGPLPPQLSVVDNNISVRNGNVAVVTARIIENGNPVAGRNISFVSSNPSVATVSPASVATATNGEASATVTGIVKGNAVINVQAQGTPTTVPVNVDVGVAVTPLATGIALALLLLAVALLYIRRARQSRDA